MEGGDVTVTITGMKTLERRLKALGTNTRGTLLREATLAGASVVRDEAERLAPKRTGKGAAGIKTNLVGGSLPGSSAKTEIGYDEKTAWFMTFQELGTKFHAARPHLRPALDTKKGEAVRAVGRVLKRGINAARRA